VFFSDRIAGDRGAGQEIIQGTPLKMPAHAEYDAFRKVVAQLPDNDSPFMFGLPDNIERSLQVCAVWCCAVLL
jgi:hypothetical protein